MRSNTAARSLLITALAVPTCLAGQLPRTAERTDNATSSGPRVVSLLPAATKIILSLGASDLIVARTESDSAPALAGLPSVGRVLAPSLELLTSVQASLVITWTGADVSALARIVERRGGRLEAMTLDRLGDLVPAIQRIGQLLGRTDVADTLAATTLRQLAEARSVASVTPRPRVLWILSTEPIVAAGQETFIADLIDVAGGVNAVVSTDTPWPRLGIESILALDPDVLIWPEGHGMFAAHELLTRPGWQTLRAVRTGRVLPVEPERYHDPGPQIAAGALDLARRLQGAEP